MSDQDEMWNEILLLKGDNDKLKKENEELRVESAIHESNYKTACNACERRDKTISALQGTISACVDALKLGKKHAHNDTCSHMLDNKYECTCGHEDRMYALSLAEGIKEKK